MNFQSRHDIATKCKSIFLYPSTEKYGFIFCYDNKTTAIGVINHLRTWENVRMIISENGDGTYDFTVYCSKKGKGMYNLRTYFTKNDLADFFKTTPENFPFPLSIGVCDEENNPIFLEPSHQFELICEKYNYMTLLESRQDENRLKLMN